MLGPRPSHTHYMVPFAPLGRCPCSVKPRPCVIPDVTCIILVHTTNTADKITTTPLLDSTLSPCPPPVDHRGDPLSHTFNIDQDIYLPHICCIQHRLGYLLVLRFHSLCTMGASSELVSSSTSWSLRTIRALSNIHGRGGTGATSGDVDVPEGDDPL